MALLLSDDFNRADNTTVIGSPVVGGPYTVRLGTWGINGNRAYTSVSTGFAIVTADPGTANIELSVTVPVLGTANTGPGLVWRWTDNNNFWMIRSDVGPIWRVWRRVAGAFGVWMPSLGPVTAGDTISVRTSGSHMWFVVNGVYRGYIQDQFAVTNHAGLVMDASIVGRLDDLSISNFTSIPGGVDGSTAEITEDQADSALVETDAFVYKGRNFKTEDLTGEA